ncbi:hypothetical protein [Nesterenkonia pannonica]|uniref:hypothetical protein n=1 Tax=Nesterenkonia pannonica TaxID=1548602 RepID=UPI0021640099|nr:hypothetical protein [Nesterenkonia pannonica]
MSPKIRVTLLVTLLIGVLVVTAGLFFGIMPQRENAAAAESQRETAEAHNALLQSQLEQLAEDSEALTERREQFARQLQAFPEENQYARYIDDLDLIADEQSVEYRVMETGRRSSSISASHRGRAKAAGNSETSPTVRAQGRTVPRRLHLQTKRTPAMRATPGRRRPGRRRPFSGRELVAVPVVIEVSGGATGIRHFVRLVQTGTGTRL